VDVAVAAIVVDVALNAVSWAGSGLTRGMADRQRAALLAVTEIKADELVAKLSPVALATVIPASIAGGPLQDLLRRREFFVIAKEVFSSSVAGRQSETEGNIRQSLTGFFAAYVPEASAEDAKILAAAVYVKLSEAVEAILMPARTKDPEAWLQLQQNYLLRQAAGTLDSISQHARNSSERIAGGDSVANEEKWVAEFLPQIIRAHGFIKLPDLDANRKVPIDDLYVSPTFAADDADHEYLRGKSFDEVIPEIDRCVVLGDPGGGKSTFSDRLVVEWARLGSLDKVAFHVILRDFAHLLGAKSILEYIDSTTGTRYQCAAPDGAVEAILISGRGLVVFDGLDELADNSKRRAMTDAVELFASKYPATKVVVTSRRVGYSQAQLDPLVFNALYLGDFNDADVRQYVERWFRSQPGGDDRDASDRTADFIEQSTAVPDLRRNPLMLSLMCIIFRGENFIPRHRPDVYERCAELLFQKWDGHRLIEFPLRARDHIDGALKYLAHWMLTSGSEKSGVSREQLVEEMTSYLHLRMLDSEVEARAAAEEFVDFCKGRAWVFSDLGSSADGAPIYTFTHRTFMEYFAAFHITRTSASPEALAKGLISKVAQEEWDVVAQLAVQLVNKNQDMGSERALRVFLDDKARRTSENRNRVLSFVARCMSFATVSEGLVRSVTAKTIAAVDINESKMGPRSVRSPWLTLLDNSSVYMSIIEDEHRVQLRALFEAEDARLGLKAATMILHGTARSSLGSHSSGGTVEQLRAAWSLVLGEIGDQSPAALRAAMDKRPGLYGAALQAGLVGSQSAITKMKQLGVSASAMWVSDFTIYSSTYHTVSLVEYIVVGCRRATAESPKRQVATLRTICRMLRMQFIDDTKDFPLVMLEADEPRGILVPGVEDTLDPIILGDQDLLVGLVLASMLLAELVNPDPVAAWFPHEGDGPLKFLLFPRQAGRPVSEFQVLELLDDDVRALVASWLAGDIRLLSDQRSRSDR
jgi:hypothetical protein